ncbi:GNAT family N-acetyltransferase [Collimonas sp.]|uniref:GNAT family N-acetyltransferase n=1 Tax=Collimonas sp. TaxID=1963772 RepID=UPI0037BE91E6
MLDTTISFETEPLTPEQMARRITDISASLPWLVCVDDGQILGYAYATTWRARAAYRHAVESSVYLSELPSIFRLPTGGFYAACFS